MVVPKEGGKKRHSDHVDHCPLNPTRVSTHIGAARRLRLALSFLKRRRFEKLAQEVSHCGAEFVSCLRICPECFKFAYKNEKISPCDCCGGSLIEAKNAIESIEGRGVALSPLAQKEK